MRFREFKSRQKVDELMPAISAADLKGIGGAAIQATRNAVGMAQKNLKTTGKPSVGAAAGAPTPQQQATALSTEKPMAVPSVGSEIVLPDKDTKRPGTYTIKGMKSGEVELQPVTKTGQTNQPKVSVKVRQNDLLNTIKAVSPQTQDKRTL